MGNSDADIIIEPIFFVIQDASGSGPTERDRSMGAYSPEVGRAG